MKYYYLPDDNEVIRIDNHIMELYDKTTGTWHENYVYGGVYSGDVPCREIQRSEVRSVLRRA